MLSVLHEQEKKVNDSVDKSCSRLPSKSYMYTTSYIVIIMQKPCLSVVERELGKLQSPSYMDTLAYLYKVCKLMPSLLVL